MKLIGEVIIISNIKKTSLGQFNTVNNNWLKQNIIEFINYLNKKIIYDPFAGDGDIFTALKSLGYIDFYGLDIDNSKKWTINDSLVKIPFVADSIIITNPPYLTKYSASRKSLAKNVKEYFKNNSYTDLYLIALEKLIESEIPFIAIVPETFINSNFDKKSKIYSITILEENPFTDTENPVCVVCSDGITRDFSEIKVYKNSNMITTLNDIEKSRLKPNNDINISFNDVSGWLALKAVDGVAEDDKIRFDFKENLNYKWDIGIKVSSRLITLIHVEVNTEEKQEFVKIANRYLLNYRSKTNDCTLSPFKGNNKLGIRRRRLDYRTARAILEFAYKKMKGVLDDSEQLRIF